MRLSALEEAMPEVAIFQSLEDAARRIGSRDAA